MKTINLAQLFGANWQEHTAKGTTPTVDKVYKDIYQFFKNEVIVQLKELAYKQPRRKDEIIKWMKDAKLDVQSCANEDERIEVIDSWKNKKPNINQFLLIHMPSNNWYFVGKDYAHKEVRGPIKDIPEFKHKLACWQSMTPHILSEINKQKNVLREIGLSLGHTCPKVFISYAWPSPDFPDTQKIDEDYKHFIYKIAKLLKKAGWAVFLDIWFDKGAKRITNFIEQAFHESHIVLIMWTNLYQKKFQSTEKSSHDDTSHKTIGQLAGEEQDHVVFFEMEIMKQLALQSKRIKNRIHTVILEDNETSIPLSIKGIPDYLREEDDCFDSFLKILRDIYDIDQQDMEFKRIQKEFLQKKQSIFNIDSPRDQDTAPVQLQTLALRSVNQPLVNDILIQTNKANKNLSETYKALQQPFNLPDIQEKLKFSSNSFALDKIHNKILELQQIKKECRIGLCGGVGTGKTSLLINYAFENKSFYNGQIFYFLSDRREKLRVQFNQLAEQLNLAQEAQIHFLINKIFTYLAKNNSFILLLYDDVEEEFITTYFPLVNKEKFVIIATHNKHMDTNNYTFNIDYSKTPSQFNLIEAEQLEKSVIELSKSSLMNAGIASSEPIYEENLRKLAELIDYHPQGMRLITQYLIKHDPSCSIDDLYLSILGQRTSRKIIDLSLKEISKNSKNLLELLCFFDTEDINGKILTPLSRELSIESDEFDTCISEIAGCGFLNNNNKTNSLKILKIVKIYVLQGLRVEKETFSRKAQIATGALIASIDYNFNNDEKLRNLDKKLFYHAIELNSYIQEQCYEKAKLLIFLAGFFLDYLLYAQSAKKYILEAKNITGLDNFDFLAMHKINLYLHLHIAENKSGNEKKKDLEEAEKSLTVIEQHSNDDWEKLCCKLEFIFGNEAFFANRKIYLVGSIRNLMLAFQNAIETVTAWLRADNKTKTQFEAEAIDVIKKMDEALSIRNRPEECRAIYYFLHGRVILRLAQQKEKTEKITGYENAHNRFLDALNVIKRNKNNYRQIGKVLKLMAVAYLHNQSESCKNDKAILYAKLNFIVIAHYHEKLHHKDVISSLDLLGDAFNKKYKKNYKEENSRQTLKCFWVISKINKHLKKKNKKIEKKLLKASIINGELDIEEGIRQELFPEQERNILQQTEILANGKLKPHDHFNWPNRPEIDFSLPFANLFDIIGNELETQELSEHLNKSRVSVFGEFLTQQVNKLKPINNKLKRKRASSQEEHLSASEFVVQTQAETTNNAVVSLVTSAWKKDNSQLPTHSATLWQNLKIGQAIGNGNCLFDSIAQLMKDGRDACDMRQVAVNYMRNNRAHFVEYFDEDEASLDTRIAYIEGTLNYADHCEISALALALRRQIVIISNNNPMPIIGDNAHPILFLHHEFTNINGIQSGHYQPITLKAGADINIIMERLYPSTNRNHIA